MKYIVRTLRFVGGEWDQTDLEPGYGNWRVVEVLHRTYEGNLSYDLICLIEDRSPV